MGLKKYHINQRNGHKKRRDTDRGFGIWSLWAESVNRCSNSERADAARHESNRNRGKSAPYSGLNFFWGAFSPGNCHWDSGAQNPVQWSHFATAHFDAKAPKSALTYPGSNAGGDGFCPLSHHFSGAKLCKNSPRPTCNPPPPFAAATHMRNTFSTWRTRNRISCWRPLRAGGSSLKGGTRGVGVWPPGNIC